MNLMKLFNINYLTQNFKKSKVILSIFIGLIPILNTIILIMSLNASNNLIFNFNDISLINYIGVYILPVIVSICLFNYVYKKSSVDFINSMPISRKSIFVTNTIFGIIIFLAMLIVNIILMSVLTLIFNSPITFNMMFDYLWYWFVVYIFAFSATNLAMTISGNAITQIVVTLLLVFLVPFTHFFINNLLDYDGSLDIYLECDSNECIQEEYYCYDDLECNINKNANIYETNLEKEDKTNYTALFEYITFMFEQKGEIINAISVIKMIILSIIYMILGYILFLKRKMEVSETSFKNKHIHNIVKCLTLVPSVAVMYIICKNASLISIIFVIVIILIYYFIYDLITKKSINNIKLSLIYFVFGVSLITIFYSAFDIINNGNEKEMIKYSDIKEVAIDGSSYGLNGDNVIYIKNKELVNIIIDNSFKGYNYNSLNNYYIKVYLKTKNNTKYSENIVVNKEDYYKIMDIISENKEYIKYYKDIDYDKIYAVKIGNSLYKKDDAEPTLKLVKDTLSNISLKELSELQGKYNNVGNNYYIKLYSYQDHCVREFNVNGYISYNLLNLIVNSDNANLKKNISYVIPEDYTIYYNNMYVNEEFEIDYYVLRNAKTELYNFIIRELENEVDMQKEYISLDIYIDNHSYSFTTNNIKEFREILDNKYNQVKDTEEYKKYSGYYYDTSDDLIQARSKEL